MAQAASAPAVGFLYPGYSAEDDYPRLERILAEAGAEVRLPLVHTDIGEDAHRVDALLEMGSAARLAAKVEEVKQQDIQAVVWACTSASFVFGWEGAHDQVRELSATAGLPASSTSFAFAGAVRDLGVERVSIAATYPEDVAELFTGFLKAAGAEVVAMRGSGIITAAEVGTWGEEEVLALARGGDHPDAQAVLLPDTALHTAAWIPALEEELGKPVLTANQVTAREGLRLLDLEVRCPALGALFT
ncbi:MULTISPECIES: decarboxylase [unclassified Streptomyces]|uniref:maleate cis-trans isomerase family protein n=1 Tax=unclassified Streptomyces TaxID=2593676 RepID=UPI002DDC43F5|nr:MULTISPECIES: decarboxylase [unclassified Streptomyces]WSA94534.1 decarboxylase [Streptomyces sp. NBC_01795]WSB78954.1 decarboxylase [Streptomyces sp. NBC_01775]WSS12844.1 decarboxylase [Streptomyces sp. NBC_01186]WSS41628.1 decarboxylase [Streptomyces sp. NBC_01187]